MGRRILIVDDNPTNLKLVAYLVKAQGYDVETASDADAAVAAIAAVPPDLILMDLQLPGVDGLELTRRLKADPATRAIKIVAVTAYAMKGDQEKALAAGCDDYVTKPIDTRALPQVIARHLEGVAAG
jgi:CheY-like chemotaxis protein